MNKIKEAIGLYNQKRRIYAPIWDKELSKVGVVKKSLNKMTQKSLSLSVFNDKDISNEAKAQLMTACIAEERKLSLAEIRKICKTLDCNANFLIGL